MSTVKENVSPKQVYIKEENSTQVWVYDIDDPKDYEYLVKRGEFDDKGNLVLSMPFVAALKRFTVNSVMESVDKQMQEISVPDLTLNGAKRADIPLVSFDKATKEQIEEYLSLFGGYKAYLETQLSIVEARKGVLEAGFEEGLNRMYYQLSQKYQEQGGKKPVKEMIRGEALATNPSLKNTKQELIEVEALYTRMKGLRDAYATAFNSVSRIVSLRASSRDQV